MNWLLTIFLIFILCMVIWGFYQTYLTSVKIDKISVEEDKPGDLVDEISKDDSALENTEIEYDVPSYLKKGLRRDNPADQTNEETVEVLKEKLYETTEQLQKLNLAFETKLIEKTGALESERDAAKKEIERAKTIIESSIKLNQEYNLLTYRSGHDLKGGVASILGLINLIKDDPSGIEKFDYIKHLETSVLRLTEQISDIATLGKMAGHENVKNIDFQKLIPEVLKNIPDHIMEESHSLNYTIEPNITFFSDEHKIFIIIKKLVENAIVFRNNQSRSRHRVELKVIREDNGVGINVWDNGIGISTNNIDKIFQMYWRGSDLSQGSGLGLYIVKKAVDALSGTITVKSGENEFSSFHVSLPNAVNDPKKIKAKSKGELKPTEIVIE